MSYKIIEHSVEEFNQFNWSDLNEGEGHFPIRNHSFWRDDDPFSLHKKQWYISVHNNKAKESHKWALPKQLCILFDEVYKEGFHQFRNHLNELLGKTNDK